MDTKKTFILIPFHSAYDSIYLKIKEVLEAVGYVVCRADSELNQRNIMSDVVSGIFTANLIVAEITERNPNVYYELGIAHTLRKNVILIAQSLDDVPFDLQAYRIIKYSTQFNEIDKFETELGEIGQKALAGDIFFSNPIIDFLITSETEENQERITNAIGEEDEKGYFDYFADGIQALEDITHISASITDGTNYIGSIMVDGKREIDNINPGNPGFIKLANEVANKVALELNEYSILIKTELDNYQKAWYNYGDSQEKVFNIISINNEEDLIATKDYLSKVEYLKTSVEGAVDGMTVFKNSLINLQNLNRKLTKASKESINILDELLSILNMGISKCERSYNMLRDIIDEYEKKH